MAVASRLALFFMGVIVGGVEEGRNNREFKELKELSVSDNVVTAPTLLSP